MNARETRDKFRKSFGSLARNGRKINFANLDNMIDLIENKYLHIMIPVCPLYKHSESLNDSVLIDSPKSIEQSRVAQKWDAVKSILDLLHTLKSSLLQEISIDITILLADLGIICTSEENILQRLIQHQKVYETATQHLAESYPELGIHFTTYSAIGVNCSLVINPNETIPIEFSELVEHEQLVEWTKLKLNKRNLSWLPNNKKILDKLISQFGISLGTNFLYSYLAPDKQLENLGNVMINIERGRSVLFKLPYFDLHGFQAYAPTIEVQV